MLKYSNSFIEVNECRFLNVAISVAQLTTKGIELVCDPVLLKTFSMNSLKVGPKLFT